MAQTLKDQVIQQLVAQLQADLDNCILAANEAHHAATHEESVAETQYDTLGLEASYLAEGQSRRVAELQLELASYENFSWQEFSADTAITTGALVTLQTESDEQCRYIFVGPAGGGIRLTGFDHLLSVVTPQAPLGQALLGKYTDDEVRIGDQEFIITAVE